MKRKIFIVDDDEMLSMMLEDHLSKSFEYDFTCFPTGEACLDSLNPEPDMIILDFNLDSVEENAANGLEILQKIKSLNRNILVVMYSSQKQYGKALQTISNGAVEYVMKDENAFANIEKIIHRMLPSNT
ncbi:MAG: response regulator [Bacteroidia bacterium]